MRDEKSNKDGLIEVIKEQCSKLDKKQRWLLLIPIIIPLALNPLLLFGIICLELFIWLHNNDFQEK